MGHKDNLIEKLTGNINKAYNESITKNEKVSVRLTVQTGQGIVVTDKRVIIIKAGASAGAGVFGVKCNSFYYNQIISVNLTVSAMGGDMRLTAEGNPNVKTFFNPPQMADNCVIFNHKNKGKMKIVAEMIRDKVTTCKTTSLSSQQGLSIVEQIKELAELKDQGVLSEEEFLKAKTNLLNQ